MKSIRFSWIFLIACILLVSCSENREVMSYSITGKAQKGPFVIGTSVTINELNDNLSQTGKSFTTNIIDDAGSFFLENLELISNYISITANGFYYNELLGELSPAQLTLNAIAKIKDKENINVNLLTHIEKPRIEKLVSTGISFSEAQEQAKSELLTFLGLIENEQDNFSQLDISELGDANAALLAFSIIAQRWSNSMTERPTLTAELSQLLANLSNDFKEDGQINNQSLIDTLLYNISRLNLIEIRNIIESRYSELGGSADIPNFEKYIQKFQEKFSSHLYTSFYYPDSAPPVASGFPDAEVPNLLVPSDSIFQADAAYSIAAIIPLNSSLMIKFICNNNNYNYSFGGHIDGWEKTIDSSCGFTLNSQRNNELMTMLFYLEEPSSAIIEYYEDGTQTPTYIKNIEWK